MSKSKNNADFYLFLNHLCFSMTTTYKFCLENAIVNKGQIVCLDSSTFQFLKLKILKLRLLPHQNCLLPRVTNSD